VGNVVAAGNGRDSRGPDPDPAPAVADAGAGSIGVAWALVFARAGHQLRLYDPAADRRFAALAEVGTRLAALDKAVRREAYCLVRDGVVAPEDVDLVMSAGLGRRWAVLGPFETAELNTRGGIDADATTMGLACARMGAERGQVDACEPELVSEVSASVRGRLPREAWAEHVAWRDQALMVLKRCWHEHPELSGPPRPTPDPAR
jgi:hypothetical protein